jgi:hypothetical protein
LETSAKGKAERPFRTVKAMHETLYHFHRPQSEAEANLWLQRYLLNHNRQPHRSEAHSRLEGWLAHLPAEGFRELCSWEHFCRLAREPERRKVGGDARIAVGSTVYEVGCFCPTPRKGKISQTTLIFSAVALPQPP